MAAQVSGKIKVPTRPAAKEHRPWGLFLAATLALIASVAHAHDVQLLYGLLVEHGSPFGLLNHRRIALRWGIEVIGAADVVVLHGRLNGRIAESALPVR